MGLEIGEHVSNTLLPLYAPVLLNVGGSAANYEIIDSVCLLCDCMENGDDALFNKISGQAGPALIKVIHHGSKDKDDLQYSMIQSAVFGLGLLC